MLLTEYLDLRYKVEKLTYAFHYQQKDGKLIFRYDNASKRRRLIFIVYRILFQQLVHKRRKKMDVTRFGTASIFQKIGCGLVFSLITPFILSGTQQLYSQEKKTATTELQIGKQAVAAALPPRYKVVDCRRAHQDEGELEKILNDYAKEGWHFRAIHAGPILILERE